MKDDLLSAFVTAKYNYLPAVYFEGKLKQAVMHTIKKKK